MKQPKAIMNWSGGKDSALTLYKVLQQPQYQIQTLLTTVSEATRRISMHGVRKELLQQQAAALGLPLTLVTVPAAATLTAYDNAMQLKLDELKRQGCTHSVFGDIFLEDLRAYRENKLAGVGLTAVFPLWKQNTTRLVEEFIDLGFKTIVACVNARLLDKSFAGRVIDRDFLKDLPAGIDPCGENGEFHTFVFDGPLFKRPIPFTPGEVVHKTYQLQEGKQEDDCATTSHTTWDTGFWYCDLLPNPAVATL